MHHFRRRFFAAADLLTPHHVGREFSAPSVTSAPSGVPFPDMRMFLITSGPLPVGTQATARSVTASAPLTIAGADQ